MTAFRVPTTLTLAVAVLIVVCVLSAVAWGLSSAARPTDYERRIAAVDHALTEIEQGGPGKVSAYGSETLCNGPALAGAAALRTRLIQQSQEAGMTARDILATAGSANSYPRLAGIDVSYTAEGPYNNARRMLALLGAGGPEVFIDQLEIKPAGDRTMLKIKGRAFCWISARP